MILFFWYAFVCCATNCLVSNKVSGTGFSAAQCRGARGLLGWSQSDLARQSKVSRAAIAAIEGGTRTAYDRTMHDIWRAFDDAGIEFFSTITDYPDGAVIGDLAHDKGFTDRSEGVSLRLSRRHADE
jgi:transcriptional regulator with XRE-family HTH domain